MADYTLVGFSGSLRAESFNTKLVREAARIFDPADFHLGDVNWPLYDADLEDRGIPAEITALGDRIAAADAVVIGNPEYNKGVTGTMKNTLDWLSRLKPNPMVDKPVAIVSASTGRNGAEISHYMLRHLLVPHRARVVTGNNVLLGNAGEHFDENDRLKTESYVEFLEKLMQGLKDEIARGQA